MDLMVPALLLLILAVTLTPFVAHVRMRRQISALTRLSTSTASRIEQAMEMREQEKAYLELTPSEMSEGQPIQGEFSREGTATSRFVPTSITATSVRSKPSAHQAGRLAAEQEMAEDPAVKLNQILEPGRGRSTRSIAFIGPTNLGERLNELGKVSFLVPGQTQKNLDVETAYLVIDEHAFRVGLWANVDNAQNSGIALRLLDQIKEAKTNETVIVVVCGEKLSHYTTSYRNEANILIDGGVSNLKWHDDSLIPVVKCITDFYESGLGR